MKLVGQKKGVSGILEIPDQGAVLTSLTANCHKRQSCQPKTPKQTPPKQQLRLTLPNEHAKQWLSLPLRLRKQVGGIVFGSFVSGVALKDLAGLVSELKMARLAMNNAFQLALDKGATLDILLINQSVEKINRLLGEEHP